MQEDYMNHIHDQISNPKTKLINHVVVQQLAILISRSYIALV